MIDLNQLYEFQEFVFGRLCQWLTATNGYLPKEIRLIGVGFDSHNKGIMISYSYRSTDPFGPFGNYDIDHDTHVHSQEYIMMPQSQWLEELSRLVIVRQTIEAQELQQKKEKEQLAEKAKLFCIPKKEYEEFKKWRENVK